MILPALAALALAAAPQTLTGCVNLGASASTHYYPVNDRTILISAGIHAYRVTTSPSSILADPSAIIVNSFATSSVVCSPQALKLRAVSPGGRSGLIVQSIETLSRAEAEDLRRGGPRRRPG